MIVEDADINKLSHFSLEVNCEGTEYILAPCSIQDLLQTETFKKFFNLGDEIKLNSFQIPCLFVVESEIPAHQPQAISRIRKLSEMEICFLVSTHLQHQLDFQAVEMKINQNSSLYAHKFKSKNDRVVN